LKLSVDVIEDRPINPTSMGIGALLEILIPNESLKGMACRLIIFA
jgi:hypothetical protein